MAAELGWSQDRTELELAGYAMLCSQLTGEADADDASACHALSRVPDPAVCYGPTRPPMVQ